jgi:hypothetical protein
MTILEGVEQGGEFAKLAPLTGPGLLPHKPTKARPRRSRRATTKRHQTAPRREIVNKDAAKRITNPITIPTFLEVLSAMHFARFVPSPVQDACGMMVVAPSGTLKSQLLMYLARAYPSSCVCDSNWHYGKLLKMKAQFKVGGIRSIIIPELSSLYAGDPRTGGRIEAMLMQLAGEGSLTTNEKNSQWERYEMRATIFGAMTVTFADRKHEFWQEGFHRRFFWAYLDLENDQILLDYLNAGKQAQIDVVPIVAPAEDFIPDTLSYNDKRFLRTLLEAQKDFGPNQTRYIYLCRTAAVLKWHYARNHIRREWRVTLKEFSRCLGKKAATLVIPPEPMAVKFKRQQEHAQLLETQRKFKETRKASR